MKKIEITVPNDVVATIVSLVMDYATELHVTQVGTKDPVRAAPAKRSTVRSLVSETRLGKLYLAQLPEDGSPVSRSVVTLAMDAAGYRASGESSVTSALAKEGLIESTTTTVRRILKE